MRPLIILFYFAKFDQVSQLLLLLPHITARCNYLYFPQHSLLSRQGWAVLYWLLWNEGKWQASFVSIKMSLFYSFSCLDSVLIILLSMNWLNASLRRNCLRTSMMTHNFENLNCQSFWLNPRWLCTSQTITCLFQGRFALINVSILFFLMCMVNSNQLRFIS